MNCDLLRLTTRPTEWSIPDETGLVRYVVNEVVRTSTFLSSELAAKNAASSSILK